MKKLLCVLLAVLMTAGLLSACGSGNTLSGRYRASAMMTETTYTFSKDGSVTVRLTAASQVILDDLKGSYSFNEEGTEITLTLPEDTKTLGALSFTLPTLSGTFPFAKGAGYIQIASTQYNKVS